MQRNVLLFPRPMHWFYPHQLFMCNHHLSRRCMPLSKLRHSSSGNSNGETHLFNRFLHVVAQALVAVNDELNPFVQHLIPMAVYDPIRHAIAALSASHLAKVYPDFPLLPPRFHQSLPVTMLVYAGQLALYTWFPIAREVIKLSTVDKPLDMFLLAASLHSALKGRKLQGTSILRSLWWIGFC
mgnify:FL=1